MAAVLALAGCQSHPASSVAAPPPDAGIPDTAMLSPADLNGAEVKPADSPTIGRLDLCQDGKPVGMDHRLATHTVSALYRVPWTPPDNVPDSEISETLWRYEPGGAARFLADLKAALARCPGPTGDSGVVTRIVSTNLGGDESVLLKLTWTVEQGGPHQHIAYLAVARVNDTVVAVRDNGYENANGDEARIRSLALKAIHNARTL
jgi:hypothetical protein